MSIERLGPLDPVSTYKKNQKASQVNPQDKQDSISVSTEAKSKVDMLKTSEEVQQTPDVREDRIAEVMKKLQDSNYITNEVINAVADKLLDSFGI